LFTFPAEAPTRRLDYLFCGPGLTVQESLVDRSAGAISDHLPVWADVVLGDRR
jgi:endonuclease/exonuclease/phosphatase family metal-dependent hydrolase